jgi:hypothetical protein
MTFDTSNSASQGDRITATCDGFTVQAEPLNQVVCLQSNSTGQKNRYCTQEATQFYAVGKIEEDLLNYGLGGSAGSLGFGPQSPVWVLSDSTGDGNS